MHYYYKCTLHYLQRGNLPNLIYTSGCYQEFEDLINDLLPVLAGIVIGIISLEVCISKLVCVHGLCMIATFLMQLVNIFLSIGLALDIHREKKRAKEWRKLHPKEPKRRNKKTDHQDSSF